MHARVLLPLLASLAAFSALGGCGSKDQATIAIDVIGNADDPFEGGARLSPAGQLVRAATAEGLVAYDEQGRVVPALADRWIVTDDGLSYIFRLRDGKWDGGADISGETGRDALMRALTDLDGTPLGVDLSAITEVRAMAGRVVEIRLSHSVPDLLDLLAQPELALMNRGHASGPMLGKREDVAMVLSPLSPERLGMPQTPDWADKVHAIRLTAIPAGKAIDDFSAGKVAAVFGGRLTDYRDGQRAAGLSRSAFQVDPVSGLLGLLVTGRDGPLSDPAVREALAMAIDRDAIAADLGVPGWTPSTRIVAASATDAPPSIGERWAGLDMGRRRAMAADRVAHLKGNGGALVLRVAMPAGSGADLLFRHLAADFQAIGLTAQRVGPESPADLRLLDAVARYGRADWWLSQLSCDAGRIVCSATADAKAQAARAESDPAKRAGLLEDAEAALTLTNSFIPLGPPVRWSLVRTPLSGFALNPRGWHPLKPLAIPAAK